MICQGGPNLKIFGSLGIHAAKRHVASSEAAIEPLLGGFGGMLPQEKLKNGAISCALRAIFNHFHYKNSLKKIQINKNFFNDPFVMLHAPPLIYLNIDVMDT